VVSGNASSLKMLYKLPIQPQYIWISDYTSEEKQGRVRKILDDHVKPEDWVVHSDADELYEYPDALGSLTRKLEQDNINAVQGPLID
jgi:hypothetical protein